MQDSVDLNELLQQLALERVGYKEWKLCIIQWVAESPTCHVKKSRQEAAVEFFNISQLTFKEWLKGFSISSSSTLDKTSNGSYDWRPFIIKMWYGKNQLSRKVTAADIYRFVKREAYYQNIDCCPSYSTVLRILKPLQLGLLERQRLVSLKKKRNSVQ